MWVGVATCSTGRPRWGEPGASAAVLLPSLEVLSSTRSPVTRVTVRTPGRRAGGRASLAGGVLAADGGACAGSGSTPATAPRATAIVASTEVDVRVRAFRCMGGFQTVEEMC